MATFDLKPLSQETIDQMGFNNHDLWLVKIRDEIHGPFEAQSLKHYASENETQLDQALACRSDENDFKPFWGHALFQRRKPTALSENHEGPFWILDYGRKHGPFSYHDIDKKIEMGLLSMTDHLSVDDGMTWKKIYEIAGFDRRSHDASELPEAPFESVFQRAKLELLEKMDKPHTNTPDELAAMAHAGLHNGAKILTLKLDELTLNNLSKTEVSESLKWAIPSAAMILIALVTTGYYVFSPNENVELVAEADTQNYKPKEPNPSKNLPRAEIPGSRRPASVGPAAYAPTPTPNYQGSRFPTQMEIHEDARYDEAPERDPYGNQPDPIEAPPAPEHSLVSNTHNEGEDQSLDAAMNGIDQPVQPVVEEASDF